MKYQKRPIVSPLFRGKSTIFIMFFLGSICRGSSRGKVKHFYCPARGIDDDGGETGQWCVRASGGSGDWHVVLYRHHHTNQNSNVGLHCRRRRPTPTGQTNYIFLFEKSWILYILYTN